MSPRACPSTGTVRSSGPTTSASSGYLRAPTVTPVSGMDPSTRQDSACQQASRNPAREQPTAWAPRSAAAHRASLGSSDRNSDGRERPGAATG